MPARVGKVRVATHGGRTVRSLGPSEKLTFGRDRAVELSFSGDDRLSRLAGQIEHRGDGISVANLSRNHSLFVQSGGKRTKLHPIGEDGPDSEILLTGGLHHVEAPQWEKSGCRITIDVTPAPGYIRNVQASRERSKTVIPMRLNKNTKEFATALVLCRPKLVNGVAAPVPSVPQLARSVLEATNNFALLNDFDINRPHPDGRPARDRLISRVHEHLRQLREKLAASGLVEHRSLPPPVLADALIDNDIIRPEHLDLLTDAEWLGRQEEMWWQE